MASKRLKRGKILKNIKIEKIWFGGVWISTFLNWKKIIIKGGVLPDSIVSCRVLKDKKDYIDCQLIKYEKLPDWLNFDERQKYICPHNMILEYKSWFRCDIGCWGCKWQILPYEKQLELKYEVFKDSFRSIWDKVKDVVKKILPAPTINWYRNKVEFSFGYCFLKWEVGRDRKRSEEILSGRGQERSEEVGRDLEMGEVGRGRERPEEILSGWGQKRSEEGGREEKEKQTIWFHRQGRWDQVVDVNWCNLISKEANELYRYIKNICINSWIPNYNQKNHQGVFRHLVIRQWFNTSEFLVNLVVATENEEAKKFYDDFKKIKENLKEDNYLTRRVKTFVITYNNWLADVVKWTNIQIEILRGLWYITEKLNIWKEDLLFRISPFSFFQTNTKWAEFLFTKALEYVNQFKKFNEYNTILDLYCWTWTIWLSFLKNWLWKSLIWIELIEEAIRDAKINAEINLLKSNSNFFVWKAEDLIYSDFLKSKLKDINLVIVDPPRDWLHKSVVKFLINLKKKIKFDLLYISCNPVTLARDIDLFLQNWELFKLRILQPVDMFPHTHHIENIAFLN